MALTRRVAICEKIMMPAATIHVTSIEFVIPKPPIWTSICGLSETALCSADAASAAITGIAAARPQTSIEIKKQRLRIFRIQL
jgi:hypothetical protein